MAAKPQRQAHRESTDVIRDGSKTRTIMVSLVSGDVITLRPKGTRRTELIAVATVWAYAVKLRVIAERFKKAAERAARKGKL